MVHDEVLEERAAEAGDRARVVRAQVLQEVGHARERAIGQAGGDGRARLVVEARDTTALSIGVARLDAGDGRVEQLAGLTSPRRTRSARPSPS